MRSVDLKEVLQARERRVKRQYELLAQYGCPLISFTMNIAGPIKNSDEIEWGFRLGSGFLLRQLERVKAPLLHQEIRSEATGNEAFYVVDFDAGLLKKLMVELEDNLSVGRLFDLDVLTADGQKLEREFERCCLICGAPGKNCSRSRAHSVEELQNETHSILWSAYRNWKTETFGNLACRALLFEACTTPKPGLVDCRNSGSHRDMNLFSFLSSASALQPYFRQCVEIGMNTAEMDPQVTFGALRWPGKHAELQMLDATGGANTHKGAIFTLGILCGALGRMRPYAKITPPMILEECAAMTKGVTEAELNSLTKAQTAGEVLFQKYHISGVRGQVEAGLPLVSELGLPMMERELQAGKTLEQAGLSSMVAIMAHLEDTNLLKRGGPDALKWASEQSQKLLIEGNVSVHALELMDDAFIKKNYSPGGAADLLAVCYFLHFVSEKIDK